MKIPAREIEAFVKKPNPAMHAVLVYGPDHGLVQERCKTLGRTVVSDLNDPFNVAILSADMIVQDPARLRDEAFALSMMGGARLIRIAQAGDKLTPSLKAYLADPSPHALLVLEADELTTRSSLRLLCEKAQNAAAIPCYVEDERDLSRLIRETLAAEKMQIDPDALSLLAASIGGNRMKARSEIEKLILYKGRGGAAISSDDVNASSGDLAARSIDDLVFGAASRKPARALAAYKTLMDEDVSFVIILRSLQNHFRRLHTARVKIEAGMAADQAMRELSPPVFFKFEQEFRAQLSAWPGALLERLILRLLELEAACKKTGAPVETLCAQAILGIASTRAA